MSSLSAPLIAPHDGAQPTMAPTGLSLSRPRAAWAIASLVALTFAAGLPGLGAWCRLTPDSFTYLDAARCLGETGGYAPVRMIVPPGFPTVLAPLLAFGDLPFGAIRLLNLGCWIASVVISYLLFRRHIGAVGGWLAAALLATSPAMAAQSAALLSEVAFLPLILSSLLLIDSPRSKESANWRFPVVLGLLCSAATFVRTMGIILVPILACTMLVRTGTTLRHRIRQTFLFAAIFTAPLVAWELRQSRYPRGNSYGRAWRTARPSEQTDSVGLALQIERLARFGPMRFGDIHAALMPPHLGWRSFQGSAATSAGWLIGGAMVLVTLWRCWRGRSPVDFYALATLAMLCFWPYDEGPRMVVPLLPLFFAYVIWAAQNAQCALAGRPRTSRIVAIALAGFLLAHLCELGVAAPAFARQRSKADERVAAMQRIADWQDANLPAGAPLACVTRPRDDAKTTLIGGSYLARRRVVQTLDDVRIVADGTLMSEVRYCFVYSESLAHSEISNGWSQMGRVEGFEIYRRAVRITAP